MEGNDSACVVPIYPAVDTAGIETVGGVVFSWAGGMGKGDGQTYLLSFGEKPATMITRTTSARTYTATDVRGNRTYYWSIGIPVTHDTLRCPSTDYWEFRTADHSAVITGFGDRTITIGDSITFSPTVSDPEGVSELRWDFNGDGTVDYAGTDLVVGTRYGMSFGVVQSILLVVDSSGGITRDSAVITIRADFPSAGLSGPDSATINDTIVLSGIGYDTLGFISGYAWKIGSGSWEAGGKDTTIVMPFTAGALRCSLRVTDDDGQNAYAVHTVSVTNGIPRVLFAEDTLFAGLGDTLMVAAEVWDDGRIRSYEWKKGLSNWTRTDTPQITYFSPGENLPDTTAVSLRVTDEDGNSAASEILILSNMTWSKLAVPADAPIVSREGFACVVYKVGTSEKLYLIGGTSLDRKVLHKDVWTTTDGLAWERIADSTALGGRCYHAATVFNYKIWVHGGYDRGDGYWDNTLGSLSSSTDGINWTRVPVGPTRAEHSMVY